MSNNEQPSSMFGSDVNIAAASIITAAARVHMSRFKNSSTARLYYSDTDSIVVNKELHPNLVNNDLGNLKLEYTIEQGVFLSPKVYAIKTTDKKTIIKIKGLAKKTIDEANLNIDDMFALLRFGSEEGFRQDKRYKNLQEGTLSIKQVAYQLRITNNKRAPVYKTFDSLSSKYFSDTKPYFYDDLNVVDHILDVARQKEAFTHLQEWNKNKID